MELWPAPHAAIAKAIEAENLRFTIIRAGAVDEERRLLAVSDLRLPIAIADMGETVITDISPELLDFLRSGKLQASYDCQACRTILRFGAPLQFRQAFEVRFRLD